MKIRPKNTIPSIPARKTAQNSYTGRAEDRVGPNVYHPKAEVVKSTILTNDFGTSAVNRKLWEPLNQQHNPFTSRENPGPGTYDENENLAVTKK